MAARARDRGGAGGRTRAAAKEAPLAAERPHARARALRALRRRSPSVQIAIGFAVTLVIWAAVNGVYQVVRKPTELFFPVSGTLYKRPAETWRAYARDLPQALDARDQRGVSRGARAGGGLGQPDRAHLLALEVELRSARGVSPGVERGRHVPDHRRHVRAGAPLLRPRHVVVEDGPWYAWRSCWFNWLYFRVVPSHAVELTSAYLDRAVAGTLARHGIRRATLAQKENLAALIHLCGAGIGERYARRGLHLSPGLRCGDHGAAGYIERVQAQQRVFAALAAVERE